MALMRPDGRFVPIPLKKSKNRWATYLREIPITVRIEAALPVGAVCRVIQGDAEQLAVPPARYLNCLTVTLRFLCQPGKRTFSTISAISGHAAITSG